VKDQLIGKKGQLHTK